MLSGLNITVKREICPSLLNQVFCLALTFCELKSLLGFITVYLFDLVVSP